MICPTRYHPRVKEILKNNTLKKYLRKPCKICDGERYTKIDENNMLVACTRCINTVEAKKDWQILKHEIMINTL